MASKSLPHSAGRKELLAAIDALAKRGGTNRDKALAAWYASAILGIDEDEALDAASVDGPGDNGCDFIFVDDEQAQVIEPPRESRRLVGVSHAAMASSRCC